MLGLIYDNPDGLFIDEAQRGVLDDLPRAGLRAGHPPCGGTDMLSSEVVGSVKRSKLDGVIVLPPLSENHDLFGALAQEKVPYVRLAAIALDTSDRVVVSNERSAVASMAEYLVGLGHRRIGYITGPALRRSTRRAARGLQRRPRAARLPAPPKKWSPAAPIRSSRESNAPGRCSRIASRRPPSSPANDDMAAGVIHTATELGLSVPRDLSVAGFDDSALATRIRPALTTIRAAGASDGTAGGQQAHRRDRRPPRQETRLGVFRIRSWSSAIRPGRSIR